ncbi:S8 family serine peptidase [Oceanobacillus halophilus]|uniref:Fibronectin type-III domain-containing protein n=1 Tax=Oceanobacillus halophilus TaxID=930130 RepID=A0A495A7W4_9BACI|nr:S8 family serine peptidase [Oceanobacillus halophilus]RKQ35828.1 hypothetical protein D8M06_06115 [Oceanobacillus halophilus]
MSKIIHFTVFMLSIFLIGIYQPIHASNVDVVKVVAGYENDYGKQLIRSNSKKIEYEFTNLSAISVTMDKQDVQELKNHEHITYIKENTSVKFSTDNGQITEVAELDDIPETERWNISQIGAEKAWVEGSTGKNVNIAIIDTGVSPHHELTVAGGIATVDYTENWKDDHGHGTHVAGVIAASHNETGVVGVAPDANIYAVKALDENGEGDLEDILEGIDWAIANNMDIINLSLGTDVEDPLLEEAIEKAADNGILIVGASGNSGEESSVIYPAKYEHVIGVSAVDGRLNIAPFSSTGPEVEFSAPGFSILSTFLDNSYGTASGTSQAAPHVTGILALLKEKNPDLSSEDLRKELIYHTKDIGIEGRDPLYGHGFVSYFPEDQVAPSDVTNVDIYHTTSDGFSIQWENPSEEDFKRVEIYLNDVFVDYINVEEEPTYTFKELESDKEYQLTIYAADRVGNLSQGIAEMIRTETIELEEEEHSKETTDEVEVEEKNEDQPIITAPKEQSSNSAANTEMNQKPVTVGIIKDDSDDKKDEKKKDLTSSSSDTSKKSDGEDEDSVRKDNGRDWDDILSEKETYETWNTETNMADSTHIEKSFSTEKEPENSKADTVENQSLFGKLMDVISGIFISLFTWAVGLFN